MNKRYIVRLKDEERQQLESLVSRGKAPAYKIKHAYILLKADANGPNWSDEVIAKTFNCHYNTVANVRRRFVEQGLEAAIERRKCTYLPRLVDGEVEAHIIALRCSPPPEGRGRWTLRLLADWLVELEIVPSISHETARRVLKKTTFGIT